MTLRYIKIVLLYQSLLLYMIDGHTNGDIFIEI